MAGAQGAQSFRQTNFLLEGPLIFIEPDGTRSRTQEVNLSDKDCGAEEAEEAEETAVMQAGAISESPKPMLSR